MVFVDFVSLIKTDSCCRCQLCVRSFIKETFPTFEKFFFYSRHTCRDIQLYAYSRDCNQRCLKMLRKLANMKQRMRQEKISFTYKKISEIFVLILSFFFLKMINVKTEINFFHTDVSAFIFYYGLSFCP